MNKEELVDLISKTNNITKIEAARVIKIFCSSIESALAAGNSVSLMGFGKFIVNDIPPRKGRNPKTSQPITVAAYKQPKFLCSKVLKELCNDTES